MLPLPRGAVWQIFFLLCVVLLANEVRSEGRVVCYYTNWSVYRPGTAKFNPQNINPYLCTHLIYAFGGFTKDNTMKPFDKYQDIEQGGYAKFTGLKTYNKQLKTMIAIGGWNEASTRFSPLVANSERRQKFIKNILKFLRQNHFDGLDLDWEYPAHRDGGKSRDKDNYAQFVQELRSEFDRESAKTGRPRLLLTMAVPAGIQYIEKGYDIPKLNKYLDWFNMLTYDFHSSHEPSANHHAPLYSLEAEDEYNFDSDLNIDYSIKYYLDAGADRDKLVLGIPTYGRSYTLFNEESTDIGAPADGPGEQGDATREKGYLAYYEICQNIKEDPDWNVVQPNPKAMGPYAFKGNQWVGYDDEAIVRKKAEYVVQNGLGGIMFWAIDNDDFRGICTGKPYPLIEAAKETYLDGLGLGDNEVSKPSSKKKPLQSRNRIASSNRNKVEEVVEKAVSVSRKRPAPRKRPSTEKTTTTSTSTFSSLYVGGRTTTPQPPTTPDPGADFKCEDEGFFQHPRDCKKYFWCLDSGPSNLGIVAHQFTCPSGLYFNPAADSCDFARNVPCDKNPKAAASTTVKPTTTSTTTARTTTASSRITAATSRNSFSRFTTTTEAPEEEDNEYEDEVQDAEEDPRVIKDLIDLIKKVGGVEELEKHLLQQADGSLTLKKDESSKSGGTTTPSTISKSLYKKVLSRPNNLNAFRNKFTSSSLFRTTSKSKVAEEDSEENIEENNTSTKYSSVVRNSRPGPQNAGIDKLPEFEGFLKEKKKYVTIQRNKPLLVSSVEVTEDEDDDDVKNIQKDAEDEDDDEESVVSSSKRPTSSSTPAYTSIRRTKPTTVKPAKLDNDDKDEDVVVEKKAYTSANRNRVRSTTDIVAVEDESTTAVGSRYKFIERTRPTRRPLTTVPSKDDADEETNESEDPLSVTVQFSEPNEISTQLPTQQQSQTTTRAYASIGRRTTITSTSTTTTDQPPNETTTPESFVIDTTTPEPIIITTTTTTTTNPTSIETSTQSFTTTTTPILALSASILSSLTSQNDDEDATIAPKIPNSLATESGLDTQELDTTKNQILTETTTIDDTNLNEVKNLSSSKATTTSNKSQSSLNNISSYNNSVRGTLKNNFSGGSRRQQQKQKTTTTTTTDTNQQQQQKHETSTDTNEFLGTVSSPRPFGFPRRRTRPTTTTTTIGVDDADASSTVPPSETTKPLAKKRVQFNRTTGFRRPTTTTTSRSTITTSTQVNPSLDYVVDTSSTSNLGLTSAESGTSADAETAVTSTEAALTQRRRIRVLKYKRPVIVNNSLSAESNNSTNTTTSSTESVDNLSEGPELETTINTTTSPTPTRRFKKVIRKLRPLANRTSTEDSTSTVRSDTRRPLNIAELFSKFNSNTTTASATEGVENSTVTEGTTSDQTETEVTSEDTVSTTTTVSPTPRRLLVNRRPYVPVKPSKNAITATTESDLIATPKTYVRKFNRNFKAIRPPTDGANGIGFIQRPQPTAQTQSGFQGANRFKFPTRTTPRQQFEDQNEEEDNDEENGVGNEEEEEEEEDEDVEEEEEEHEEEQERVVVAPIVRQRVLFNRNQAQPNEFKEHVDEHTEDEAEAEEDEEEGDEEDEEEDARPPPVANRPIYIPSKRPSNRPSFNRPSNSPFVPNRQGAAPSPVNRFALDRRPSNKPRTINRPTQITLPPNLLDSDQATIPSSITQPSVFVSTNTRSYERKYSASTENVLLDQSNPLLEDLDIDALNARNKKIFEVNSKKHTTTIKPRIIQNQPQPDSDTTDTTPYDTTTVFEDEEHEDNNLIISQDDSQVTTTTTKVDSKYAQRPVSEGQLVSYSPKKKIITVSRVVEINSKEAKLRRKSKDEELKTVELTELRSEGLPKLEALGEISRVKHVHLVDGSDIVVDGHSTVTDYTPTEASVFVRNTIPEVEPDSLENTKIDYQSGPTSAPVRNTIPDVDYSSGALDASIPRKSKGITVPEVISDVVEASTISLQGLFDSTRQAKKISEAANEVNGIFYAYSLGEIPTTPRNEKPAIVATTPPTVTLTTTAPPPTTIPTTTTTTSTTTTTATTTTTPIPTTIEFAAETTIDTTTVAAPISSSTTSNRTYTRPIVPLLRPESNESPLVISIANLDKVILSKVLKSDSNSAPSIRQESIVAAPKNGATEVLQTSETGGISSSFTSSGSSRNSIETKVQTETSFSSESHVVKLKKTTTKRKHKSRHHRKQATTISSIDLENVTTAP